MNTRASQTILLSLLVVLLTASGCQGFLANRKVQKIEGMVGEIRPLNPEQFKKTEWENATKSLDSIKSTLAVDASSANTQAQELLTTMETLVADVKNAAANDLFEKVNVAKTVMDKNDGRGLNPQLNEEILAQITQTQEDLLAQKYDSVISNSNEIIRKIDTLLVPAKQKAEARLQELVNDRESMNTFKAPQFAPEIVTEVDQTIVRVNTLINNERDYISAEQTAARGRVTAQQGINKANKIQAQLKINQLETRLRYAVDNGAEIYCQDLFNQANATLESIIQSFFQDEYTRVLSTIDVLAPNVDSLVFCTLTRSIKDKLDQLTNKIERHREGGVPEYLPGRVERLEEKVTGARTDFDVTSQNPENFPRQTPEIKTQIERSFERIKLEIQEAFILSDKIDGAFDDLAAAALRDSEAELNVADDLFAKLEGAFMQPTPADVTPMDPQFTANKEALRTELGRRLVNNRFGLDEAKVSRGQSEYRKAIERARSIQESSADIQNNIYRLVADNAIIELENQIARYTREGAAELTPDDLARTREYLDEGKSLVQQAQYKSATVQLAKVRAQLDVTIQVLGRAVLGKIDGAREAIAEAEDLKAAEFAPETLSSARDLVDQAQSALSASSYRRALQLAEQGRQTAGEARTEAGLAWSRSEIDMARDQETLAEAANAVAYAPLEVRQAQNQLATARSLREKSEFAAAAETAAASNKAFRDATYARIDQANEAVLNARRSEGFKYEQGEFTKAVVKGQQAEEAIAGAARAVREGNVVVAQEMFDDSRQLAEESRTVAEEVTAASQAAGVRERLARVRKALEESIDTGANYFQVTEVKRLLKEAEKVQTEVSRRSYDDIVAELNRIDAEFNNVINATPERVAKLVASNRARIDSLVAEESADTLAPEDVAEAKALLNDVELDFREGAFSRAYVNLKEALDTINGIEMRVAERAYQMEISALSRDMNESLIRFDAVLRLKPDVFRRMAFGPDGRARAVAISNVMLPTQFKQNMDDLYFKALAIVPPASMMGVHKQVIKTVEEGRMAAAEFQQMLIFDEMDVRTVDKTIESAYKHYQTMLRMRTDIVNKLIEDDNANLDHIRQQRDNSLQRALIASGL